MKLVLVNGTEVNISSASGTAGGGLSVQVPVTDQSEFVTLLEQLTDANVAQINVCDGDSVVGRYANQKFLSAQLTQVEDIEGVTSLIATITTKGQDNTQVRLTAVENEMESTSTTLDEILTTIIPSLME